MAKKAKKVAAKAAPKAAAKGAKEVVNKGMLVDAVAEKLEGAVSKKDTKAVLDALLTTVVESVRKGGEVRLVGFGTFKQSHRAARTGRNPQTGAAIQIAASDAFTFKSSIKF
jgi:nucleoid DNA-binding protein